MTQPHEQPRDNRCKRKSCPRRLNARNAGKQFCSNVCFSQHTFFEEAQSIVAYLGHSDLTDEFLMATIDLDKALNRLFDSKHTLRRMSTSAGWTHQDFNALCRGDYGTGVSTQSVTGNQHGEQPGTR